MMKCGYNFEFHAFVFVIGGVCIYLECDIGLLII